MRVKHWRYSQIFEIFGMLRCSCIYTVPCNLSPVMQVAIQCSDLDARRIDGTRVYIWEVLNRLGGIAVDDRFFLYHRGEFNSALAPKNFPNYEERKVTFPVYWTQTRLAWELFRTHPDRLWMPVQGMPILRPKGMETIVTIHDLAFRKFPQHFPKDDLRRLLFLSDMAIRKSDRIIAVSESTKKDILEYYPDIAEDKVTVVYHGYEKVTSYQLPGDQGQGTGQVTGEKQKVMQNEKLKMKNEDFVSTSNFNLLNSNFQSDASNFQIPYFYLTPHSSRLNSRYLLYVGAIQPRKNLETLISAFEMLKKDSRYGDLKLVLAGERAWMWESTISAVETSPCREDIVLTGAVTFAEREELYRGSSAFVFPSLYEGFGLPVLEAFAHNVPVVCADNSSLPEVGGEGAVYFSAESVEDLSEKLRRVLDDETLRAECVRKGQEQLKKFSWDKCARETMEVIRG